VTTDPNPLKLTGYRLPFFDGNQAMRRPHFRHSLSSPGLISTAFIFVCLAFSFAGEIAFSVDYSDFLECLT
jgi:hypothetical protein